MEGQFNWPIMLPPSDSPTISAPPAGIARRLGALLYDVLLIVALWMITALVVNLAFNDGNAATGPGLQLLLLAEVICFYLYFWHNSGQTIGMRAWRLKLVDSDGQPPTLRALVKRMSIAPLSLLCAGLGYVWYLVGSRQQTWHDRFSDTYVVLLPKKA